MVLFGGKQGFKEIKHIQGSFRKVEWGVNLGTQELGLASVRNKGHRGMAWREHTGQSVLSRVISLQMHLKGKRQKKGCHQGLPPNSCFSEEYFSFGWVPSPGAAVASGHCSCSFWASVSLAGLSLAIPSSSNNHQTPLPATPAELSGSCKFPGGADTQTVSKHTSHLQIPQRPSWEQYSHQWVERAGGGGTQFPGPWGPLREVSQRVPSGTDPTQSKYSAKLSHYHDLDGPPHHVFSLSHNDSFYIYSSQT